jgi:mRNA interferase MazF
MVGNIYFINMPYSDFTKSKGRPVLVYKKIDKDDLLILPITSNLQRDGIVITDNDIEDGSIKKTSVVIVPKLTAVDSTLIIGSKFIASLKEESFINIKKELCIKLECSD